MGNWCMVITGVGPHGNKAYPQDVEQMMPGIVKELVDAGHHIESAHVTMGGRAFDQYHNNPVLGELVRTKAPNQHMISPADETTMSKEGPCL